MRTGFLLAALCALSTGCASHQVARNVKLLSFSNEPKAKEVSIGSIQGKSCQWQVFGWPLGPSPTVRTAFENAVKQRDGGQIPGSSTTPGQAQLTILRNVGTDTDFMSLYLVNRACVNVTGTGVI
ncbi:MAG: hypothetical protein ACAH59_11745 [Pseudobdellovibrionaceae bacterium]